MQWIALLLVALACSASARPLAEDKNGQLSSLLAFQSVLAESPASLADGSKIKIFVAPYRWSECDGTVNSCPDLRLYIVVAPDNLGYKARLYRLPNAKGWAVHEWAISKQEAAVNFTVETCLPEANISTAERKAFRSVRYRIRIQSGSAAVEVQ